jgi:hypothetical protein
MLGIIDVLPDGEYRAQVVICRITRNAEGFETSNLLALNQVHDFVIGTPPAPEGQPPGGDFFGPPGEL